MSRLQEYYRKTVVPQLTSSLGLKNPMQVPRITKITLNMGVGEAVADRKVVDAAAADTIRRAVEREAQMAQRNPFILSTNKVCMLILK